MTIQSSKTTPIVGPKLKLAWFLQSLLPFFILTDQIRRIDIFKDMQQIYEVIKTSISLQLIGGLRAANDPFFSDAVYSSKLHI